MWVAVPNLRGKADRDQQFVHLCGDFLRIMALAIVDVNLFYDVKGCLARVQRTIRVLKDHLDLTPMGFQLLIVGFQQVGTFI